MSEEKTQQAARTVSRRPADAKRTCDPAAMEMLECAACRGEQTMFDRYVAQSPQCPFGLAGICCRICIQGPCRINPRRPGADKGICGASEYTIVARNIARYVAGGAACHSDHGRHAALTLLHAAEGKLPDYKLTDTAKLRVVAERIRVQTSGRSDNEVAKEVALAALADYADRYGEPCRWLSSTITAGRQDKFKHCDIAPDGIDKAIVQVLHRTAMGMDADPVSIIFGALRTALADYTGMHIATDITDILFGTPEPVVSEANLGVIDPEYVNLAIHGHNPILSEVVVDAARNLKSEAVAVGAKGVNVVGICCTGNELLMREGVYLAANQSSQELAVMTGAVDAMLVDIQCIAPSVRAVCECYHTKLITTADIAKIPGSHHFDFREDRALETAEAMVRLAVAAFAERDPEKIHIPKHKATVIAGWSLEALLDVFSKVNPESPVAVLTDAIRSGELKGVCLLAGCNNLKGPHDEGHLTVARELAKNDVFMVATGCSAGAFAKAGMMNPDAVERYAGRGLKAFLARLSAAAAPKHGLPLIFHMGSCVDNTRAQDLLTLMAKELGVDTPKVPFVASAPEAMHEKAVSIGSGCVALGIPTHVGVMPHIEGSQLVYGVATQIARDVYGGFFIFETDPTKGALKLIEALDYRSWKLRVHHEAATRYGTAVATSW
ncbi:MAG: anaerobic carbon-monoxide dehydrogenase catalytic subunit [Bacillota bacterium]|nr:anaerobic carbon-monoxide dehydrogenase catalytic subunit [Bacillota bacterium]